MATGEPQRTDGRRSAAPHATGAVEALTTADDPPALRALAERLGVRARLLERVALTLGGACLGALLLRILGG